MIMANLFCNKRFFFCFPVFIENGHSNVKKNNKLRSEAKPSVAPEGKKKKSCVPASPEPLLPVVSSG